MTHEHSCAALAKRAQTFVMGCNKCTPDEFAASCNGQEAQVRSIYLTNKVRGPRFLTRKWPDGKILELFT